MSLPVRGSLGESQTSSGTISFPYWSLKWGFLVPVIDSISFWLTLDACFSILYGKNEHGPSIFILFIVVYICNMSQPLANPENHLIWRSVGSVFSISVNVSTSVVR